MAGLELETLPCPDCGAVLPVEKGYVTWCDSCGWNLVAPAAVPPGSRLRRMYASAGRKLGERMVDDLGEVETLERRLTWSLVAAYGIAAAVHALTLALVAGGAFLVWTTFPNLLLMACGALMTTAGILMRPRIQGPPSADTLRRTDAPDLYRLLDRVAAALRTPTVDLVGLDPHFNASFAVLGLRRLRVLALGLPLLATLDPQERVALFGHELAHSRNRDSSRGLVVGSAIEGLTTLYYLLAPGAKPGIGLANALANGLLWLLSRPVLGALLLLRHLLHRESQRAEYLADALAARVAGTSAVIALHEKMLLASTVETALQGRVHRRDSELDLFDEIGHTVLSVPERERERRRRMARLEEARLDLSHPPTGHRIRLLERRPALEPLVVSDAAEAAAIDAGLAPHRSRFQERLIETRRDRLYAGHR